MSRAVRSTNRRCGGSGAGSISPNAPSRASTKPARARRNRWESAAITDRAALEPPSRMQCDDAAGEHAIAHAAESGGRDHFRKGSRLREAPDRFDEKAIGLGIADNQTAERRNDVERIKDVKRVE